MPLKFLLYYFLFYSFFGWVIDSAFVSIANRKFINRGFLNGPFCPIYGFGAIFIILWSLPFQTNLFFFFFQSVFIASLIEYLTGFLFEKLFKTKLWDYSDEKFNLNGRICLKNSLYWGFLSILILKFIHPFVQSWTSILIKYLGSFGASAILAYFIIDSFISIISLYQPNISRQFKRISKSFPHFSSKIFH
jgi:uncharacterized membrane protein